jgi:hypothetical protein
VAEEEVEHVQHRAWGDDDHSQMNVAAIALLDQPRAEPGGEDLLEQKSDNRPPDPTRAPKGKPPPAPPKDPP